MTKTTANLTPANENPWYVLMTLYGEQKGEEVVRQRADDNRRVWNAWACHHLADEDRMRVVAAAGVDVSEAHGWKAIAESVRERHRWEMMERNGDAFEYRGFPDANDAIGLVGLDCEGAIALEQVIFSQPVIFRGTVFKRDVVLRGCVFMQNASFGGAQFTKSAVFDGAMFEHNALFNDAVFDQTAGFDGVAFSRSALFNGAKFSKDVNFQGVEFGGTCEFQRAQFGQRNPQTACQPNFQGGSFTKVASFRDAIFCNQYPLLEGAKFNEGIVVTAKPEMWPNRVAVPLLTGVHEQSRSSAWQSSKESCAVLRRELAKQSLPEDEHFFFRREMRFTAQIGGWWARLPYRVFGALSNFGQSISRPVISLLVLWAVPALVLMVYFAWLQVMGETSWTGGHALGLSFSNIFTFFGFHRVYFDMELVRALPAPLKVMGAAQTIAALPLLFFLGLGLRKRFRLR